MSVQSICVVYIVYMNMSCTYVRISICVYVCIHTVRRVTFMGQNFHEFHKCREWFGIDEALLREKSLELFAHNRRMPTFLINIL